MIQIDLLDENYTGALVPVFSMKPEKLYFFYDRRNFDERHLRLIRDVILSHGDVQEVTFLHADKNSYPDIYAKMKELLEQIFNAGTGKERPGDVCIELTGGEALMAISAARLAEIYPVKLVCADLKKGWMIHALTGERIKPVVHMTLDDFLSVNGAKRLESSHRIPEPEEYDRICRVAEFIFVHLEQWHAVHQHITTHLENKNSMRVQIPEKVSGHETGRLVKILCENGYLQSEEDGWYGFPDEGAKAYVTVYGIWLELYVYIKLSALYDEVHLGLVIDWNRADEDSVDNEIDIVVMKYSIPILISCKMTKPKPIDIYEIFGLAKRVDISAKSMLATTYAIDDDQINGVRQRAKKMKVGLIEVGQFRHRPSMEVFNQALQMTI